MVTMRPLIVPTAGRAAFVAEGLRPGESYRIVILPARERDSRHELRATAVHYVEVRFAEVDGGAVGEVGALPHVRLVSTEGPGGLARFEVTGSLDPVVAVLARHAIADLAVREQDLETLFLGIVGTGHGRGGTGHGRGGTGHGRGGTGSGHRAAA